MKKMKKLTIPQLRMLGRVIAGEALPLARFRREHASVRALEKKGCLALLPSSPEGASGVCWVATDAGKEAFVVQRAKWKPAVTVDGAAQASPGGAVG